MGKEKVSKFLAIIMSFMLVFVSVPLTSSGVYAASRNAFSVSSLLGKLSNKNNNKTDNKDQQVSKMLTSTSTLATSGSSNDIKLNKTANPVLDDSGKQIYDGDGNPLFDIALNVEGSKIKQSHPVDITLIIDNSGSMTEDKSTKLANTKTAAKSFVNSILGNADTQARISVVKFSNSASAAYYNQKGDYQGYSNNAYGGSGKDKTNYSSVEAQVNNSIDAISGGGATNTEAGLVMAKNITTQRNRPDAESIVIFLTDGVPTYYSNGGTSEEGGDGSYTENTTFDKAVTAAKNLKDSGNTLYSIGFLTDYDTDSFEYKICEHLLSKDAYYTANIDHNKGWFFGWYIKSYKSVNFNKTTNPANFVNYYQIKKGDDASTKINNIYTELANKINEVALAKGTIVDVIPEDFKFVESLTSGGTYNSTNKTVTYTDIEATDSKVSNTFRVAYIGHKYGRSYTNVSATYNYTLYNNQSETKNFNKPSVYLQPKTENDEYDVSANQAEDLDILPNDPSFIEGKIEEDGYTVEDLQIVKLSDPKSNDSSTSGTATATVNDSKNKVSFVGDEGDYTFTYKVIAKVTKNGQEYTVESKETTVVVHVAKIANKAFVIDFGKPVTYSSSDVFTNTELKSTVSLLNSSNNVSNGTYGNMSYNTDKSITYKLRKMMSGIDRFNFNIKLPSDIEKTKTVSMIPATSIYYDDGFTAGEDSNVEQGEGIVYGGNWKVEKVSNLFQDSTQGGNYGYDTTYLNQIGNSDGTIHYVDRTEADNVTPRTKSVTASIKFKGTGIDIYSHTDTTTRSITVRLYQGDTLKSTQIIDQVYQTDNEKLYQIPVVSFKDLPNDTYTVKITASKNTSYYLDGLRIYNPIGSDDKDYDEAQDQYDKDNEKDTTTLYLRDAILNKGKDIVTKVKGSVYIDKYTNAEGKIIDGHIMDVDSTKVNTTDMDEYVKYGFKPSEVYLPAGKSITMTFDKVYSNVQLGLKTSKQSAKYTINEGSDIDLTSSTDMYYKVTVNDDGTVTIKNTGNVMIEITSIKVAPNKISN